MTISKNLNTQRRDGGIENYVDCYTSLAAHGIKLDDRNKLAIKDYVDTALTPSHANVLQDTPVKELRARTFLMQHTKNPNNISNPPLDAGWQP